MIKHHNSLIRIAFAALCVISAMSALGTEIYRQVDENGHVTFSDRPQDGGEPVKLSPINRTPPVTVRERREPPQPTKSADSTDYESIRVSQPADDEVVRDNTGNLAVSVQVVPKLAKGHRIRLLVDGTSPVDDSASGQFQLTNVDRGSHELSAQVIDDQGNIRIESEPVTVHLKRHALPPR